MKRIALSLCAFIFAALTLCAGDANIVRKAPELAYKVPDQGDQLLSHYRGKVVALAFIKTTCPHCQAASRFMTEMQKQYGPRGFEALDIAINAQDDGENESQSNLLIQTFSRSFQVGLRSAGPLETSSFSSWVLA